MAAGAAFDALDAWLEEMNIARAHEKDMKEKVQPAIEAAIAALGDEYMAAQVKSSGRIFAVVTLETKIFTNENRLTVLNENYGQVMVTNSYAGTDVVSVRISGKSESGESTSADENERVAYKYTVTRHVTTYSVELERASFDELLDYAAAKELPLDVLRAEAQRQLADTEDIDNRSVDLQQMAAQREAWTERLKTLDAYQADISRRQANRAAHAKVMKANQARKDKEAQDKRDKDELAAMLAADKARAARPPAITLPGPTMPGTVAGSGQPSVLGPFDIPEVSMKKRGELIAAAFERKKEEWVACAKRVEALYENDQLSEENRVRFRNARDEWIGDLNRYEAAMRLVEDMRGGANRLKAIQDWLSNDGHNALLIGI